MVTAKMKAFSLVIDAPETARQGLVVVGYLISLSCV